MSEMTFQLSPHDVRAFRASMDRAQKKLGKSSKQAVAMAGRFIARSLSAATKIAPKLRPIVENPDKRYKTDARRAPLGVFKYRNGQKYFAPIFRTGEFGKIRFFNKKTFSWFERHNGSNKWESLPSGPDVANPEIVAPGIVKDRRRNIGRRGMARKMWQWAAVNMNKGGAVSLFKVPSVGRITIAGGDTNPSIKIEDNLRYAADALKPGALSSVVSKALAAMAFNITRLAEKKLGAK
jgi:hypothetical protein